MRQVSLPLPLVWHSYLLASILGLLGALWHLQAIFCLALLLFTDSRLWRPQRLALTLICFASALTYSQSALEKGKRAIETYPLVWHQSNSRFCAEVEYVQSLIDNRLKIYLRDVAIPGEASLPGSCVWTWENPAFEPIAGQKICLARPVKPVSAFANSETDSYLASLFSQRIYWRVWSKDKNGNPEISGKGTFLAALREKAKEHFLTVLGPDSHGDLSQAHAILFALIFGERRYLSQTTTSKFGAATLAHSLALSGQHLAIVGLVGLLIVLAMGRLNSRLYLKWPRKFWILLAALPLTLIYLWLGNAPASLLRAAYMLFFGCILLISGRPFSGLDLLALALTAILLFNPLEIFNVGLQMSALCVATIVLGWPAFSHLFPDKKAQPTSLVTRICNQLKIILAVSFLIQLALLPLTLIRFQTAGVWFSLNIIWLPILGAIVLPAAMLGLFFSCFPWSTSLAKLCVLVASSPCEALLRLLDFLNDLNLLAEPALMHPAWTTLVAYFFLVCTAAWVWTRSSFSSTSNKIRAIALVCICIFAIAPTQRFLKSLDEHVTIEALDVGQGQAILVSLPQSIRVLIDGGGSYNNAFDPGKLVLAPLISDNQPPHLTAVINTHPDQDHLGGLLYILKKFKISSLFHNGREARNPQEWLKVQEAHQATILAAGDSILLGDNGWKLEVLAPKKDKSNLRGNAASLVLRLTHNGEGIAVFPGDADKNALKELLAANPEIFSKLVFAPHHGSDKNFLQSYYEATKPEAVLACCGFRNRWNYPGRKLKAWLAERDIPLLDTGTHGRITVKTDAKNLKISSVK